MKAKSHTRVAATGRDPEFALAMVRAGVPFLVVFGFLSQHGVFPAYLGAMTAAVIVNVIFGVVREH